MLGYNELIVPYFAVLESIKSKNIREHLPARSFRIPQEESGFQLSPYPNSCIDEGFIFLPGLFHQQCLKSLLFAFGQLDLALSAR
jgi:hypothetical protein